MYVHVHGDRCSDDLMYSSVLFANRRVGDVTMTMTLSMMHLLMLMLMMTMSMMTMMQCMVYLMLTSTCPRQHLNDLNGILSDLNGTCP